MANKILVARGTKARLEEIKSTLAVNELVYSTDIGELGVKKANGNIEYFKNAADIDVIVDTLETSKQDKLVAGDNITIVGDTIEYYDDSKITDYVYKASTPLADGVNQLNNIDLEKVRDTFHPEDIITVSNIKIGHTMRLRVNGPNGRGIYRIW